MILPQVVVTGPITWHVYGLVVGVAIVLAVELAERVARKERLNLVGVRWAMLAAGGGGIVGARAYHVIDQWGYYQQHLEQVVMVWRGGLAIWGAVAGGVLGLGLFSVWAKVVGLKIGQKKGGSWVLTMADIAGLVLPLAQAVGRLGNWVNQELYGLPTRLPWAIYIEPKYRLPGFEWQAWYHPLFLYEMLGLGVLAVGLWGWYLGRGGVKVGEGKLVAGYFLGYGGLRFWLEDWRLSVWQIEGVAVAKLVALMAMTAAAVFLAILDFKRR